MTDNGPDQDSASDGAEDGAHPHGSFFGRRKGHKLRSHQSHLVDILLPQLAIDVSCHSPANLLASFDADCAAVRLEIGFGGGEHLVAEAIAHPTTGFIGCEPYVNGMAKILAQIERHGLRNIRLFAGDAADFLAWAPARSLARVDLIHPDPWPKRRHWKRRFVQHATIAQLSRVITPGGEFRFVSDIDDYCAWTLALFQHRQDFRWTAERADDWRCPWPGFTLTRYGGKARREGRRSTYLRFQRCD